MEYEVISVFSVERVQLQLQELEALQLVELLVREERVRGQESEELQLVTVIGQELDSLYVLPAVSDGETDEVLVATEEPLQAPPTRSRPLVPQVQIFTVGQVVVVEEGILNKRVLASHQIYKVTGDYLCLTLRLDLRSRDGLVLTEDIV